MKTYGTWHAFIVEQLAEEENIGGFLYAIMEEYQTHGDFAIVRLALQYVVEAQGGISELVKETGINPQVLSEVISSDEAPRIDALRTVLNMFGCRLSVTSLRSGNTDNEIAAEKPALPPQQIANPNLELDASAE